MKKKVSERDFVNHRIKKLAEQGHSGEQIAGKVGLTPEEVGGRMRDMGICTLTTLSRKVTMLEAEVHRLNNRGLLRRVATRAASWLF